MSRLRRFYFTGSPIFEPILERFRLIDTYQKKRRQDLFLVGIAVESPAAQARRRSSGSKF
jgi:hypothetical protein